MIHNAVDIEYLHICKQDEGTVPTKSSKKPNTLADVLSKQLRKKQKKTLYKKQGREVENKENTHPNKKPKLGCGCTKSGCVIGNCSCYGAKKGCDECKCKGCKNTYGCNIPP